MTDEERRLAQSKHRMQRFLDMPAPDIIVFNEARILVKRLDAANGGRRWRRISLRSRLRTWWQFSIFRRQATLRRYEEADRG